MVCVWNGKSSGQWIQEQWIHRCSVDTGLEQKAASGTKEQEKMYLELKGMLWMGSSPLKINLQVQKLGCATVN